MKKSIINECVKTYNGADLRITNYNKDTNCFDCIAYLCGFDPLASYEITLTKDKLIEVIDNDYNLEDYVEFN